MTAIFAYSQYTIKLQNTLQKSKKALFDNLIAKKCIKRLWAWQTFFFNLSARIRTYVRLNTDLLTHYSLELTVYLAQYVTLPPSGEGWGLGLSSNHPQAKFHFKSDSNLLLIDIFNPKSSPKSIKIVATMQIRTRIWSKKSIYIKNWTTFLIAVSNP